MMIKTVAYCAVGRDGMAGRRVSLSPVCTYDVELRVRLLIPQIHMPCRVAFPACHGYSQPENREKPC